MKLAMLYSVAIFKQGLIYHVVKNSNFPNTIDNKQKAKPIEELTELKFNKEFTAFIHKTPNKVVFYTISSHYIYEGSPDSIVKARIISDNGEKTLLTINYKKKKIIFELPNNRYKAYSIQEVRQVTANKEQTEDIDIDMTESFIHNRIMLIIKIILRKL